MVHLQAAEAVAGQPRDHVRADGRAPPAGERVRQHADPAGVADETDRLGHVRFVLVHPVAAAGADPGGGEGILDAAHQTGLDKRLGHVRASDHAVGQGADPLPGHRMAVGGQLLHHALGAGDPFGAQPGPDLGEHRLDRVEQVGEQVQAHPAVAADPHPAGDLRPRQQGEAGGQRRRGLGQARGGVMIGERDGGQA